MVRVKFGQYGSKTFAEGASVQDKKNYIARHKVNEDWNNPLSAGALARWILWEYPSIKEGVKYFNQRFKLQWNTLVALGPDE